MSFDSFVSFDKSTLNYSSVYNTLYMFQLYPGDFAKSIADL